jgi:hypothetical protein
MKRNLISVPVQKDKVKKKAWRRKKKKRLGYIMYDELRTYLAQQDVYNRKNNAQRLSLDDVLT